MKKILLGISIAILLFTSVGCGKKIVEANDVEFRYDGCYYDDDIFTGVVIRRYSDGSILSESPIKDGKGQGIYKEYFENGNLKKECEYKMGKLDGIYKEYYKNKQLSLQKYYEDNIPQKEYLSYYENGNMYLKLYFKDGLYEGNCTSYHINGNVYEKIYYEKGLYEGDYISYYGNGNIYEKGIYKKGLRKGVWYTYYGNGNLKREGIALIRGNLIPGNEQLCFDGQEMVTESFTDLISGIFQTRIQFIDDETTKGIVKYYYPNGQLKAKIDYKREYLPELGRLLYKNILGIENFYEKPAIKVNGEIYDKDGKIMKYWKNSGTSKYIDVDYYKSGNVKKIVANYVHTYNYEWGDFAYKYKSQSKIEKEYSDTWIRGMYKGFNYVRRYQMNSFNEHYRFLQIEDFPEANAPEKPINPRDCCRPIYKGPLYDYEYRADGWTVLEFENEIFTEEKSEETIIERVDSVIEFTGSLN
jgi:antitoxin component YwqK of YwqJK toxin-antitoxin module